MSSDRHLTIYRTLTALYPRSFRSEYRDDLALLFSHQITDEPASRVWCRTIRDLAVTVPTCHLEAHMNRPPSRVLLAICSVVAATSAALALMIGAGAPSAGALFGAVAVVSGAIAVWTWRSQQPVEGPASFGASWWKFLAGGLVAMAATFTAMAIPWPDAIDLGDNAYWLVVISIMTGLVLSGVGLLLGATTLIRHHRNGPAHGAT